MSVFFFRCACRQVHWQCLTVEDLQSMADYNVLQRDPYTGAGKKTLSFAKRHLSFTLKNAIVLPRQARDKYGKTALKNRSMRFPQGGTSGRSRWRRWSDSWPVRASAKTVSFLFSLSKIARACLPRQARIYPSRGLAFPHILSCQYYIVCCVWVDIYIIS
eukprot:COSAG06_NODE_2943_length_6053_cov_18.612361_6_plen_160_part_00